MQIKTSTQTSSVTHEAPELRICQPRGRVDLGHVRSSILQLGAVWLLGVPKDDLVLFYRLHDFILDMTLTQIHDVQTLSSHTAGAV